MISIIVPCYKQAHYLPETLDSVSEQTYSDWECIIVNDGSPDNTEQIAKIYCQKDPRFKYLYKENGGIADARNYGIKNSHGEYILPLDSDDKISPQYIEKAIFYFEHHPNTKLVYCMADRFGGKNEPWVIEDYSYQKIIWSNIIFCSAIYRRTDFDQTTGYNVNMKYGLEDWDFWLSLLDEKSHVYRIPEILFHYRYRENSRNEMVARHRMNETLRQIYRNHKDIYNPYAENLIQLYNNCKSNESFKKDYEMVIHSISYKLVFFLLFPFIYIKRMLRK